MCLKLVMIIWLFIISQVFQLHFDWLSTVFLLATYNQAKLLGLREKIGNLETFSSQTPLQITGVAPSGFYIYFFLVLINNTRVTCEIFKAI